jgi:hypothetical protein
MPTHLVKPIAWAAAKGLVAEDLPSDGAVEFYEEATRDRPGGFSVVSITLIPNSDKGAQ